jgi:hypothetical protein
MTSWMRSHSESVETATPSGVGEVGAVMDLAVTAGEERKKAAKAGQIADVGNEAHIRLGVSLQKGGESQLTAAGAKHYLRETAEQGVDFGVSARLRGAGRGLQYGRPWTP